MNKLIDKKGRISLIELFAIIILCMEFVYAAPIAKEWVDSKTRPEIDDLTEELAYKVAMTNSNGGLQSPINNCEQNKVCGHREGTCEVGYFDATSHHIEKEPMKGYNLYKKVTAQGVTYEGETNTLVIKVAVCDGKVKLSWVKGQ